MMDRREILQSISALGFGAIFPTAVCADRESARVIHIANNTIDGHLPEDLILYRPRIGLVVLGGGHGISHDHPRLSNFHRSVFLSHGHFLGRSEQQILSATFYDTHMVVMITGDSDVAPSVARMLKEHGILVVAVVAHHAQFATLPLHVDALIETQSRSGSLLENISCALVDNLTQDGICNLDFEVIRSVLVHDGKGVLGVASVSVVDGVAVATRQALESLGVKPHQEASTVLVAISAPSGAVKLQDVKHSLDRVTHIFRSPGLGGISLATNDIFYSLTPNNDAKVISVAILANGIQGV